MNRSEASEIALKDHVSRILIRALETQKICNFMTGDVIKDMEKAKENLQKKYGDGLAQILAMVLAADSARTMEICRFSLIASTEVLSNGGAELLIDGAEAVAQILQEGLSKDSSKYIAKTLNIKSGMYKDLETLLNKKATS